MFNNQVLSTYSVLPVLEKLSDINSFKEFCINKNITFDSNLVRGYSFSVVCAVNHLIEQIADAPQTLGLNRDRFLYRAQFVGLPYYNWPYQSPTGIAARNFVELYRPFLGVKTWADFLTYYAKISAVIIQPLKEAFEKGFDAEIKRNRSSVDKALNYAAIWFTNYIILDFTEVRLTYEKVYKKGKHTWERDPVPLVFDKQEFFLGYKLAAEYLLKCFSQPDYIAVKGVSRLVDCRNWQQFNRLFPKIRAEDFAPGLIKLEQSKYYDSVFNDSKIQNSLSVLHNQKLFVERPLSTNERLDQLFMWYDVSMLDVGNNLLGFSTILKGYASFKPQNIEVIKIAHPQEGGIGNNYSFAILLESFGLISDSCYWLLFYNFATDYSGTGGAYYDEVLRQLKNLRSRVHVTEASVDTEDLLAYLESYRVKKLTTRGQELLKLSENLKGGLFELLISHILSRMLFETTVRYRNSTILGKLEIDVIAVKRFKNGKLKIIIAEAFGSFPNNDNLRKTQEMTKKISLVNSNLSEILEDIGIITNSKMLASIEGWIFTYDNKSLKRLAKDVRIFDIGKIKLLCKKYDVDFSEFSEYLKKHDTDFSMFS